MEAAIDEVDADLPVYDIRTIDEVAGESAGRQRARAILLAGAAATAVLLAGIGVFGVTAYGVTAWIRRSPCATSRSALLRGGNLRRGQVEPRQLGEAER